MQNSERQDAYARITPTIVASLRHQHSCALAPPLNTTSCRQALALSAYVRKVHKGSLAICANNTVARTQCFGAGIS